MNFRKSICMFLLLSACRLASAQFEESRILLGPSASFNYQDLVARQDNQTNTNIRQQNNFSISILAGKYIRQNKIRYAVLNYSSQDQLQGNEYMDTLGQLHTNSAGSTLRGPSLSLGQGQFYPLGSIFGLYHLEGMKLGYSLYRYSSRQSVPQYDYSGVPTKGYSIGLYGNLGGYALISKHVILHVEISLLSVNFGYSTQVGTDTRGQSWNNKDVTVGLDGVLSKKFTLANINLGMMFLIGSRSK
jgi:hypothetical protein